MQLLCNIIPSLTVPYRPYLVLCRTLNIDIYIYIYIYTCIYIPTYIHVYLNPSLFCYRAIHTLNPANKHLFLRWIFLHLFLLSSGQFSAHIQTTLYSLPFISGQQQMATSLAIGHPLACNSSHLSSCTPMSG